MQQKVPQNIDIQDKVIGPLTIKQFLYLVAGMMILMTLKFSLPEALGFIFIPLALPIGAVFLALGFYEPNGRSLDAFAVSVLSTITRPKKRIWKKENYDSSKHREGALKKAETPTKKEVKSEDLERLAFIVDSGGFEQELRSKGLLAAIKTDEQQYISEELTDPLSASEKKDTGIKTMLETAKEKIKELKKEPSVQDLASVKPTKTFHYETIQEKRKPIKEDFEKILELAKKREEDRFDNAKIKRT